MHKGRWTKWVESFNSYRLGYLSKRKAYPKQKFARMASAFCDWNESHKCPTFAGWRKCTMEENGVIWNLINLYFFSIILLLYCFFHSSLIIGIYYPNLHIFPPLQYETPFSILYPLCFDSIVLYTKFLKMIGKIHVVFLLKFWSLKMWVWRVISVACCLISSTKNSYFQ